MQAHGHKAGLRYRSISSDKKGVGADLAGRLAAFWMAQPNHTHCSGVPKQTTSCGKRQDTMDGEQRVREASPGIGAGSKTTEFRTSTAFISGYAKIPMEKSGEQPLLPTGCIEGQDRNQFSLKTFSATP